MAVVDITKLLDKEEGTAFDQSSILFQAFDDGDVFYYDRSTADDFKVMFDRDGKANTLEKVLALPIRQAPYSIQPDRAEAEVHEFVEKILTAPGANGGMSTSMNLLISQMTQAIVYRKAYFEKVWTEREGRIVYDKVAWRPPATCAISRDKKSGAFRGFRQEPIRLEDTEEVKIPAERAFVYIHGTHRNPMDGVSDLEIAYWCFQTKQKIRFLWYQFLEGQSLPKTIVKSRSLSDARKAASKIIQLRQGGVAALEESVTHEVLESSGRGAGQFVEALRWLDSEASQSVLAGFTDLGATAAQGIGSFALSKDQTDFFLMSEQAKSKEMADFINQYLIPPLVHYNFGPKAAVPIFEFGPISQDDTQAAISLLQATAQSTSPVLPREFYDELIERVAGFLELDVLKVREGLERARIEAENANPQNPEVAGMTAVVNKATNAVVDKQIMEAGDVPEQGNGTVVPFAAG